MHEIAVNSLKDKPFEIANLTFWKVCNMNIDELSFLWEILEKSQQLQIIGVAWLFIASMRQEIYSWL